MQTQTRRILVIGPSWVGDMVMAQSLFKAIKANTPASEIQVLAPGWSEPVLRRMPEISGSLVMPVGHGSLRLGTRWKLARQICALEFDQAIVLPGSLKSALIPWFAGVPKRTGFVGEQRWGLLNDIRKLDSHEMPLNVERYASLALAKEAAVMDTPPTPQLVVSQGERQQALEKFRLNPDKPVLGFCPGAEYGPAKRWPARHFAEVAKTKHAEGWQVWIFGSAKDTEVSRELNRHADGICTDLCGETNLGEAIDLMSCSNAVVSNDSGLMHIAAAVGVHVVALYGSSSDQFTPPLTDKCDRLNLNLECSPCFKRECPLVHFNCLDSLPPSRVLEKLAASGI